MNEFKGPHSSSTNDAFDITELRERALSALREGRFDLAEELIASGDVSLPALIENLRIYQAELEIQNEELSRSQQDATQALERFTALFQNTPIAELVIDRHGLIISANPAASRLFALRDLRAHHHFLLRLVSERDRGSFIDLLRQLSLEQTQASSRPEIRFETTEGRPFFGDLHGARLPNTAAGEPRLLCAIVDQTAIVQQQRELRQAYDQLASSQEAYHVLSEYSPDWDYWISPEGRFIHVSPGCRQLTGYPASAFLDDPELVERLLHPDDRAHWQTHLQQASEPTPDDEHVLMLRLRDRAGRWHWIEHECRAVLADDGRNLGRRGVNRDVTQRHESELRYRALFESAAEGMLVMQGAVFTEINQAALHMLGYANASQVRGKRPDQLSPKTQPDGRSSAALVDQILTERRTRRFEWLHQQADGSPLPVEVTVVPVELEGEPAYFVHWLDRTEEAKARQRDRQASTVFEFSSEAIMIADAQRRILAVNRAFSEITGYDEAEMVGAPIARLSAENQDRASLEDLWLGIAQSGSWRGEIWQRRQNGETYPVRLTITAVRDDQGEILNYIGIFSDISEAKRTEEELYRLAHHDALTGLPNRALLRARMEQSLQRAKRDGKRLALLFIDLDLFKNVNDSLGHSIGDELLQNVAQAIEGAVRKADTVARIGGDEFVILMDAIEGPSTAAHLAERLCALISQPFEVGDRELRLTASIGISLYPDDGEGMDSLLSNADLAMYRAKDRGRNTYRFFEAEMNARAMQRLHLETALRGALTRGELQLVYQPQVSLDSAEICGAEVLMRWSHAELGDISPAEFIPIAEEIGLIGELGRWALEQACQQLAAWDAEGFRLPRLAVNISVQQVEHADLVAEVEAILERTGVSASRLELEITESLLMRNVERVITNLGALRDLGVTLAVDDFGSGFSSMRYLKTLPINRLKIDKYFVDGLSVDGNDDAIARAIIALGRALGLHVIGEGIETEAQAAFLRREGCEEGQGYLFGRPMGAAALAEAYAPSTPRRD
jgi:diguanylate cyclase (GGDEF)-like protein/PAS domain S-box-containing protein